MRSMELKAIEAQFERSIDECSRGRWVGSNGERQLGRLLFESDGTWVVLSEHTRTFATLGDDEFEFEGNDG